MANSIALTIPNLTTPGPTYATQVSNDLTTIATHNHDGVNNGALINISGQLVESDLSIDGYNLTNVQSVEFLSQPSVLSGAEAVNCVYVNQNNLGFNNSNGIFVPITNGNSLAVTSLPFTNLSIRTVSSNFTILNTDTYNTIDINSTAGSITGTLPIAATITPQAAGRLFLFRDVSYTAGTNPITIQVAVSSGNTFAQGGGLTSITINNNGGYVAIYTDGVSKWFTWTQNVYNSEAITYNNATIDIKSTTFGGSTLNLDSQSSIINSGAYGQVSGAMTLEAGTYLYINGATQNVYNSAQSNFYNNASQSFATGTQSTFASGSTLTVNGTLAGTTTGGNLIHQGVLTLTDALNLNSGSTTSLQGTTNQTGTLNLYNSNNNLTGHLNVSGSGQVLLTSGAILATDKSSVVTSSGLTNLCGVTEHCTVLSPGSYTCDSNSGYLDYRIGLLLTTNGTFNITLPTNPALGRHIIIEDFSGMSQEGTLTWVVNVYAQSGYVFSNNTGKVPGTGTPGGTTTTFQLAGYGNNVAPWFSYDLIYVNGGVWKSNNWNG